MCSIYHQYRLRILNVCPVIVFLGLHKNVFHLYNGGQIPIIWDNVNGVNHLRTFRSLTPNFTLHTGRRHVSFNPRKNPTVPPQECVSFLFSATIPVCTKESALLVLQIIGVQVQIILVSPSVVYVGRSGKICGWSRVSPGHRMFSSHNASGYRINEISLSTA